MSVWFLCFITLIYGIYAASVEGDKVFRMTVSSREEMDFIQSFMDREDLELDLWTDLRLGPVDLRVPKKSLETVQEELLLQIPHYVLISDLEALIEREQDYSEKMARINRKKHRKPDPDTFFKDYQDLSEIQKLFRSLPHVKEVEIGRSGLDAPIYGYTFGNGSRSIVFHGGIHAREWIAVATVSYIGYHLATSEKDSDLRQLFTFHVIPVLNVDGYAYTRTGDSKARLWRKNRQVNDDSPCLGVDINRNFDYAWGQKGGASTKPCAEDFKGPYAFSTPEALAIASYLKKVHRPISYIDFHSYSQLWLFAWGHTCNKKAKDYDELMEISKLGTQVLFSVNKKYYEYGDICNVIYPASGSSVDWAYGKAEIKYTFTLELPPANSYLSPGFLLPATEILPVGQETYAAVTAVWRAISKDIIQNSELNHFPMSDLNKI